MTALDDHATCLDKTCQSRCHDVTDERKGKLHLQCFVCGTGQWVQAPVGYTPPAGPFEMPDGRFEGKSLDEIAADPRGLDYIQAMAKEHRLTAVRQACTNWLATLHSAQQQGGPACS